MKNLKKNRFLCCQLIATGMAISLLPLYSIGNSDNATLYSEKKIIQTALQTVNAPDISAISVTNVSAEIEKAKKEGKAVFLVITGTGAKNIENAGKIANDAKIKYAKSVVITLNRDEATNSALVTKFGVAGVSVPFFLVISPKGVPVAGYQYEQATTEVLVNAIPTPKQDEVLFAISEKKPVFVIVSKKGLTDKAKVLTACKTTSSKITSKPAVVEFDFADAKETAFLKKIGISSITDKSKTVVVNSAGQVTGTYEGVPVESELTASANKVIKSSCCPGGSSSGCGTKK